jgi:hypothetical protein
MNAITRNSRILLAAVLLFSTENGLGGGGMYIDDSSPTLTNVTFFQNQAANHGGGTGSFESEAMLGRLR